MKILLPLILVIAAVGAVFWVLAPADDTPTAQRNRAARGAATSTPAADQAATPADNAKARRASKFADIPTVYPPERATVPPGAKPKVTLADIAEYAAKNPTPMEPVVPFNGTPRWGRHLRTDDPLRVQAGPLKDSIRRYYGNLSKTGPVPAVVRVEELLPADLIAELNLPPNGRVTELGSYLISERQGFKDALALDDTAAGSLGITVVDQTTGESVREYIFTGNEPE